MRFSIIIAIFNVEKYLYQCIESILNQTFADFEVILVNDGSKDSCGEICEYYKKIDSRIITIHKDNGGLVTARKEGLKQAHGEYILNVDGDDYIDRFLLEKINMCLSQYSVSIVAFNYNYLLGNTLVENKTKIYRGLLSGNEFKKMKRDILWNRKEKFFSFSILPSIVLKVFKRDFLYKFQMSVPDGIKVGEDLAVSLPAILESENMYFLDFAGYNYRYNDQSLTNSFDRYAILDLKLLMEYFEMSIKYDAYFEQELIAYYIYRIFLSIVSFARCAENKNDFNEYTNLVDEEMINKIKIFQYPSKNWRAILIPFIIINKLWSPFWFLYHKN